MAKTLTAETYTTGADRAQVDELWRLMRQAITAAYKADAGAGALRDYAKDNGYRDALDRLLKDEIQAEKAHQRFRPDSMPGPRTSTPHRAKVLLLAFVARGAETSALPPATDWMEYRRECVEAQIIGFLIRNHVSHEWRTRCARLDYCACK